MSFIVLDNGLIKSPKDKKIYEYFRLNNGIKCLNIQDKNCISSYFTISIASGSFKENHDSEFPRGIAHLTEHLLLMGHVNEKDSEAFSSFVSNHGGSFNGFTTSEETGFSFNLSSDVFLKGLAVFGSFFTDPQFNVKWCEGEVKAVDEEFARVRGNVMQKMWHVIKANTDKGCPLREFECGNKDSLNASADVLVEQAARFFDMFYSSDLMGIVCVSRESKEEMQKTLNDAFGGIPNKQLKQRLYPHLNKNSFSGYTDFFEGSKGKLIEIETDSGSRTLNVLFSLPPVIYPPMGDDRQQRLGYESVSYLNNLLANEDRNSVYSTLSSKGLISNIYSNVTSRFSSSSLFCITINLTPLGEQHLSEVLGTLQTYLEHFRDNLNLSFYEQCTHLQKVNFSFYDNASNYQALLKNVANKLLYYEDDVSNLVSISFLDSNPIHPPSLKLFLSHVADLKNSFCVLLRDKIEGDIQVEPHLETRYCVSNFDVMKISLDIQQEIRNPYLPTDLSLVKLEKHFLNGDTTNAPIELFRTETQSVHFKQDAVFRAPKVYFKMRLFTDYFRGNFVENKLFLSFFSFTVREKVFFANKGGVNFGRYVDENSNLVFIFQGFSSCLDKIIIDILESFFNFKQLIDEVSEEILLHHFQRQIEQVKKNVATRMKSSPISVAQKLVHELFEAKYVSDFDKLKSVENISLQQVLEYGSTFVSQKTVDRVQLFGYGNWSTTMMNRVSQTIQDMTSSRIRINSESKQDKSLKTKKPSSQQLNIEKSVKHVYFTEPSSNKDVSGLIVTVYLGPTSLLNRKICKVLSRYLSNAFFNEMRRKQNICYNCFCSEDAVDGRLFLKLCIESNSLNAAEMEERVVNFVQEQAAIIKSKDVYDDFTTIIKVLSDNESTVPTSMGAEQGFWWSILSNRKRITDDEVSYSTLTPEIIGEFATKLESGHICAIGVCSKSKANEVSGNNPIVITNTKDFKVEEFYQ